MGFVVPAIAFFALLIGLYLVTPVKVLANILKSFVPVVLVGFGAMLIIAKQVGIGAIVFFAGIALWRRTRGSGKRSFYDGVGKSGRRTAALEVEIDSSQQVLNGVILVGRFEGFLLENLSLNELQQLRAEILEDEDSLVLLDSYLDRGFAGWRENADPDIGAG